MKSSYSRKIKNIPEKMFAVNSIATKVMGKLYLAFLSPAMSQAFFMDNFVIFGSAFGIFSSGYFLNSKFENALLRRRLNRELLSIKGQYIRKFK